MKKSPKVKTDEVKSVKMRHRFNFIDFILILLAAFVIFTAINIVSPMSILDKLNSDPTHTIHYTVEILGVDDEYIEKVKENDAVVDSISKHSLGTVVAVDYNTRHTVLEYDETQNAGVLSVYPDKYDIIITVTAKASYKSGEGYSVNGHRIAVGERVSLRFPDYVGEGYCVGISKES